MAAELTELIPESGLELVLNKIGVILLEELTAQQAMPGSDVEEFEVYVERTEPYDKSEPVCLSVSCSQASYSGKNQFDTSGDCTFYIDIFARAKGTSAISGSTAIKSTIHKFVRLVRGILGATHYKTLGFPPGTVGSTLVSLAQFDDNYGKQEGAFFRFARVTLLAKVMENTEMWEPIQLQGNDSRILLAETEKGYKLTYNN